MEHFVSENYNRKWGCRRENTMLTAESFLRKSTAPGEESFAENSAGGNPYQEVLQNFAEVCGSYEQEQARKEADQNEKEVESEMAGTSEKELKLIADGREGYHSLLLTNAIYLSSWEKRMVTLPEPGTEEEKEFERCNEKHLAELNHGRM